MPCKKSHTAFDQWWSSQTRHGMDPSRQSPYDIAKLAFAAGRASVPKAPKLQKALTGLLDLLEDWNAGFEGFGEVNAAEAAIGRKLSSTEN